jgi:hypothetical protein
MTTVFGGENAGSFAAEDWAPDPSAEGTLATSLRAKTERQEQHRDRETAIRKAGRRRADFMAGVLRTVDTSRH